jgi:nucleoside-diphosphate-sugar epimerase
MADIAAARNIFQQVEPDLVFHLSGVTTASPDRALVLPTLHSLLISTVNVLLLAAEISCRRVVLAASLTEPMPNVAEVRVGSPYAAAKWAGGVYANMFRELYGVPVVVLRPFMTYGPGQNESKVIPYIVLSLLKGVAPKLSSGRQQVDWIYVDDVVDGLVAAACLSHADTRIIDLGSGTLVSIRDIVKQLVRLSGAGIQPIFDALPDRIYEPARVADLQHAHDILNWEPRTPLLEGLARTVEWYRSRLAGCSQIKP